MGTQTPQETFTVNVEPMMSGACGSCHGAMNPQFPTAPSFLGLTGPAGYYMAITTYKGGYFITRPENSPLLLKGQHSGPAFTSQQNATVSQWLLAEVAAKGTTTPTTAPNPTQPRNLTDALQRFRSCMSLDDWNQTYGADTTNHTTEVAWQDAIGGNGGGQGGGRCYACHSAGQDGAYLLIDSTQTFNANILPANFPASILKFVTGTSNGDGTFKGLVANIRFISKGQETGTHPAFQLTDARTSAITDFVSKTLTRYNDATQTCAPGTIPGNGPNGAPGP
jgi:mono/diheme cytochrome c family protein